MPLRFPVKRQGNSEKLRRTSSNHRTASSSKGQNEKITYLNVKRKHADKVTPTPLLVQVVERCAQAIFPKLLPVCCIT